MVVPVYRNGKWVHYTVPSDCESSWNSKTKLIAASMYATALSRGLTPHNSAVLAECYVNKQLFKDLMYNAKIEETLKSLLV